MQIIKNKNVIVNGCIVVCTEAAKKHGATQEEIIEALKVNTEGPCEISIGYFYAGYERYEKI